MAKGVLSTPGKLRCSICCNDFIHTKAGTVPKFCGEPCRAVARRRWQKSHYYRQNPEVRSTRSRLKREARSPTRRAQEGWAWRLRNYGLTQNQWQEIYDHQGGACAICGTVPEDGKRLCVDHDHNCCPSAKRCCGKCVRGLLCTLCNQGLGQFRDQRELVEKALAYLDGKE